MDSCCNLILVGVAADGEKPGVILFHEHVPGFKTADWTILDSVAMVGNPSHFNRGCC